MTKVYMGIDPGKKGGIAIRYQHRHDIKFWKMPKTDRETLLLIEKIHKKYKIMQCTVERAQAFPGNGVVAMFNYGQGFGFLIGIITALRIPLDLVRPMVWQKTIMQGIPKKGKKTKERALIAACNLFPQYFTNEHINLLESYEEYCEDDEYDGDFVLPKVHDGIVDAVLISEYTKRIFS